MNNTSITYHVTATRLDDSHALAEARGHRLTLNVKKSADETGFNAAETLLGALGAAAGTIVDHKENCIRA
jgi:hypothetical protein